MRKFKKLYNLAFIFTLIGVFLGSGAAYALRPPMSFGDTTDGQKMATLIKERFPSIDNISFADLDTGTGEFVTNFSNLLKKHFKNVDGVGVEDFKSFVDQAVANGHNVIYNPLDAAGEYEKAVLLDSSKDIVIIKNILARYWSYKTGR